MGNVHYLKIFEEKGSLKPETEGGERKIINFSDYKGGLEPDSDPSSDEFKKLLEELNFNFRIGRDLVAQMEKIVIGNGDEDLIARMKIFHRKFGQIYRMMKSFEN